MRMLIVNQSDLMMHSYCSYVTLVEVKMGMMMIDSYYLLIVVIAMNSISCEKSPVLYPYCKDLIGFNKFNLELERERRFC